MSKKKKTTTDAVEIIHQRYFKGHAAHLAALAEERANAELARKIYELRGKSGLTQRQLAQLVGTTASVICRLEDADYEGHSLAMLNRIAAALNRRVEIAFKRVRDLWVGSLVLRRFGFIQHIARRFCLLRRSLEHVSVL